jgi:hypothetical protein
MQSRRQSWSVALQRVMQIAAMLKECQDTWPHEPDASERQVFKTANEALAELTLRATKALQSTHA